MKHPIDITVDPLCAAAYITYATAQFDGSYHLRRDSRGRVTQHGYQDDEHIGVVLDVDENDSVIGIELLDVDDADSVAVAREFAVDHGFDFPSDVRAAAHVQI
jgi:uncharacterized protein YuzE